MSSESVVAKRSTIRVSSANTVSPHLGYTALTVSCSKSYTHPNTFGRDALEFVGRAIRV